MENTPMTREYKGYTIRITPYEDRCSRFAVAVTDPEGREFKHQRQAGKSEERAFAYGERIVDWELGYKEQLEREKKRKQSKAAPADR